MYIFFHITLKHKRTCRTDKVVVIAGHDKKMIVKYFFLFDLVQLSSVDYVQFKKICKVFTILRNDIIILIIEYLSYRKNFVNFSG